MASRGSATAAADETRPTPGTLCVTWGRGVTASVHSQFAEETSADQRWLTQRADRSQQAPAGQQCQRATRSFQLSSCLPWADIPLSVTLVYNSLFHRHSRLCHSDVQLHFDDTSEPKVRRAITFVESDLVLLAKCHVLLKSATLSWGPSCLPWEMDTLLANPECLHCADCL